MIEQNESKDVFESKFSEMDKTENVDNNEQSRTRSVTRQ